jgi:surface carbohydrate biosynthesis protein (TIGR04326 family)
VSPHPPHVVADCEQRRHELTDRYVAAIASLGRSKLDDCTIAELLTVDGIDAWAASSLRESSFWTGDGFFARITALATGRAATQQRTTSVRRARIEALAYALRSSAQVLRRRNSLPRLDTNDAAVVFVDYATKSLSTTPYMSPYFGKLSEYLHRDRHSVGWLHLTSSGTPTSLTAAERSWMRAASSDPAHAFVRQFVTPSVLVAAVRSWWRMQRRAPRWNAVVDATNDDDLRLISVSLAHDYVSSVHGTVAMRTMLLGHALRRAVASVRGDAVVVHPFEGQGWETLLINECVARSLTCVSYVHTIMKPWDVRALTALKSVKVENLVVHGAHDETEIRRTGSVAHVAEALRYQHLGRAVTRVTAPDAPVLFVGGADCEESTHLFDGIVASNTASASPVTLWVKWHPQCVALTDHGSNVIVVNDSLEALFPQVRGVILAGTAAPLDSYLAGLPTCSVVTPGAFSTNPLTPDDRYHVATDAAAAIRWMAGNSSTPTPTAGTAHMAPDVGQWFVIDPDLPRWRALIDNLTGQRSDAR